MEMESGNEKVIAKLQRKMAIKIKFTSGNGKVIARWQLKVIYKLQLKIKISSSNSKGKWQSKTAMKTVLGSSL